MGRITNAFRERDRTLARETLWSLGQEGASLFATIVSFSLLGRTLGIDGYGNYASLYAIVAPLGTLAVSGVTLALVQHVIRQSEDLEATARSCLSMTLCIGVLLTFVGAGIASYVVRGLAMSAVFAVLLLEFVSVPCVNIAASVVQIRDGFAAATRVRLVPIGFRVAVIVVLWSIGHLSILTLGATYLVVNASLAVALLRRTGRRYGLSARPGRIQRRHLKSSAIYSAGISGLSLQNDGDKAVLASYRYQSDTGLYSAAYRVVQLGLIPVGSLIAVTHFRFLEHEPGRKRQHLMRSLKYGAICAGYGIVFAIGVTLAGPLLTVVLGQSFEGSVTMTRWLAPLVPLRALASFPLNGLMGLGRTFARTMLLVGSAVVSMALYIALIPHLQWKGAALGTLIGEGALAVAAWGMLLFFQNRSDRRVDDFDLTTEMAEIAEIESPSRWR